MPALVGIDLGGAVQAFSRLPKIAHAVIEVEKLKHSLGIIGFTIGGIEQLAEKLKQVRRGPMGGDNILHHQDKRPALAAAALELFQLARQCHSFSIDFRVDHGANQGCYLMDTAGILFKELPDQGLGIDEAVRRQ